MTGDKALDIVLSAAPEECLGHFVDRIDAAFLERWSAIYSRERDPMRTRGAFATVLTMRAYLQVVTPRPPGNIHTRLRVSLHGRIPLDEPIRTGVWHATTELKRGRRYVNFHTQSYANDDQMIIASLLQFIWGR